MTARGDIIKLRALGKGRKWCLGAELTDGVAAAGQAAAAALVSVVVVKAALTVGAIGVVGTVSAVATVTRGPVQLCVEVTLRALPVTVAGCGRHSQDYPLGSKSGSKDGSERSREP